MKESFYEWQKYWLIIFHLLDLTKEIFHQLKIKKSIILRQKLLNNSSIIIQKKFRKFHQNQKKKYGNPEIIIAKM